MGGKARRRGMHTVSIYCDRRWFCRPLVMRPPWRRRSKKDPGFSFLWRPSRRLFRVLSIFVPRNGPSFFAPAHTRIPHRDSSRLSELPAAARLRRKRNASTVLEIHSASELSDIRDKTQSIKNTPRKFPTWIDTKRCRATRYMNTKFLKILRNILLAGNFPAGILCSQSCPLRTFGRFRSSPSCVNLKLSRSKLLGLRLHVPQMVHIFFDIIN